MTRKDLDLAARYIAGAAVAQRYYGRAKLIDIMTGLVKVLYEENSVGKFDEIGFLAKVIIYEHDMRQLKGSET